MSDLRIVSEHFPRLATFLQSPSIFSVMVHKYDCVGIIDSGKLSIADVSYPSPDDLRREILSFLQNLKLKLDHTNPVIEIPFSDGTYMVITDEPVTLGPTLTIEMPQKYPKVTIDHFLKWKSLSRKMGEFLKASISRGINVVVSSNDEVTRTVFLNSLTRFTTRTERIVVIDHNREVFAQNRHVTYLRSHLNFETKNKAINSKDLIELAARRGADRLILNSLDEVNTFNYMRRLASGTRGLSTVTSDTAENALKRVTDLGVLSAPLVDRGLIEQMVNQSIHLILQINRQADNQRRIVSIDEVIGGEDVPLRLERVYEAVNGKDGIDFQPTGYIPRFTEMLANKGTPIDSKLFE